jgi:hypothetical protein
MLMTWMMLDPRTKRDIVRAAVGLAMPYPFGKFYLKACAHRRHRDGNEELYPPDSEELRRANQHSKELIDKYYG